MFTDTHCHVFKEYYNNIDSIINNAKENKIFQIINNGCNHKSNLEVLDLITRYPNMYGAIGIHPEEVDNYNPEELKFIEDNLNNPKIVAIGEIGLDYHYTKENKQAQIELFESQLSLAEKYHKPVIIHSQPKMSGLPTTGRFDQHLNVISMNFLGLKSHYLIIHS